MRLNWNPATLNPSIRGAGGGRVMRMRTEIPLTLRRFTQYCCLSQYCTAGTGALSRPRRPALAIGRFRQPLSGRRRQIDDQVRWKIPPVHVPEQDTATRWVVCLSWNGPAFGDK